MAAVNIAMDDFEFICRSCLDRADNLYSMFNTEMHKNLPRLFFICMNIKISDIDGLPRQMCEKCVHKLISFYDFRIQCQNSNDYLKTCISVSLSSNTSLVKIGSINSEADNDDSIFWNENLKNEESALSEDELPLSCIISRKNIDVNITRKRKRKHVRKNVVSHTNTEIKNEELLTNKSRKKIVKTMDNSEKHVGTEIVSDSYLDIKQNEKNEYICNICCENMSNKEELKIHKCLHYLYICKLCQNRFKNAQDFQSHECMKNKETDIENERVKALELGDVKDDTVDIKTNCIKTLICHICDREFKYTRSLQYHIRSHTGEKPALCTWCGKGFREQRGLLNHVRAVHTGEKRFKCSFCPKAFPVSGKRRQHERVHTGEKPYQCDICCRLFAARTTLNAHRRRHTGENKFICKIQGCDQGFYAFSTYQRHMWAHRGERPYPCTHCGKTYLSTQNLRSHIKAIHTKLRDEVCHICGKGFADKSVLNRHLRKIHNFEPKDNKPVPAYGTSNVSVIDTNSTTSQNRS